jgi:hypothetical protein
MHLDSFEFREAHTRPTYRGLMALACAVLTTTGACNVYDSELIAEQPTKPDALSIRMDKPEATGAITLASTDEEDASVRAVTTRCGNAVVDSDEHCDVAIARGQPGACPDGCSGSTGCTRRVLSGNDCAAQCVQTQIVMALPDDGCCPPGASADTDTDCAAVCGNGVRERGEQCDPSDTCVRSEACVSPRTCWKAQYTGDPAHCSAHCALTPIEACVDNDDCCPAGCTHDSDHDCEPGPAGALTPDPTDCQSECHAPTETPSCASMHTAGACEACDCAQCEAETRGCLSASDKTGSTGCAAIARCAAEHHCNGLDCYCGELSPDKCRSRPAGPCAKDIQAAAGPWDVFALLLIDADGDSPVKRASALLDCRKAHCTDACGSP